MTKLQNLQEMPKPAKIQLLQELGYDSDGNYVIDEDGKRVEDKYTGDPVKLDNMFIYPGSTVILDNNPLSISSFFEEYGDVL